MGIEDQIAELAEQSKAKGDMKSATILYAVAGGLTTSEGKDRLLDKMREFAQNEVKELNAPRN